MLWSFVDFEIDSGTYELCRAGTPVAIQRKPLLVLLHLIEHADRVVSTAELISAVWQDVKVTPASVRRAIKLVRKALSDRQQRIVTSMPGYGYRFTAELQRPPGNALQSDRHARTATTRPRRWALACVVQVPACRMSGDCDVGFADESLPALIAEGPPAL